MAQQTPQERSRGKSGEVKGQGAGDYHSHTTTDPNTIRRWIEERGGHPAAVKATMADGEPGILRVDFDPPDASLERIDWETFFRAFEENELAFLYQEHTRDGGTSRFFKFVARDHEEDEDQDEDDEE